MDRPSSLYNLIKINPSEAYVTSLKEIGFNWPSSDDSTFYNFYELLEGIIHGDIGFDGTGDYSQFTAQTVEAPALNKHKSISAGAFKEKPHALMFVPAGSVIYPLSLGEDKIRKYSIDNMTSSFKYSLASVTADESIKYSEENFSEDLNGSYDGLTPYDNQIHNLLPYEDGKRDWKSNWFFYDGSTYTGTVPVSIADDDIKNPVKAKDCVKIVTLISGHGKGLAFKRHLTLSAGTYCFSFYMRSLEDLKEKVARSSDLYNFEEVSFNGQILEAQAETDLFEEWTRYVYTFTLASETEGDLVVKVKANLGAAPGLMPNDTMKIKATGMLLEKSSAPSPYDYRWISYLKDKSDKSTEGYIEDDQIYINNRLHKLNMHNSVLSWDEVSRLSYPIAVNLESYLNDKWTISYKKLMSGAKSNSIGHYDRLGNVCWGILNGKFRYGISDTAGNVTWSEGTDDLSKFYGSWLTIVVSYNGQTIDFQIADSVEHKYSLTISDSDVIKVPHWLGMNDAYYTDTCDNLIADHDDIVGQLSGYAQAFSTYTKFSMVLGLSDTVIYNNGKINMKFCGDTYRDLIVTPSYDEVLINRHMKEYLNVYLTGSDNSTVTVFQTDFFKEEDIRRR